MIAFVAAAAMPNVDAHSLSDNPFAVLAFIAGPVILTSATRVLAMPGG